MASMAASSEASDTGKPSGAGAKKGSFKKIKLELQQMKSKWGDDFKPMWTRPPPPWPVRALRIIRRTEEAEMYDVPDLRIRLVIQSPHLEQFPVNVEISNKHLPQRMQLSIAGTIKEKWIAELQKEQDLPEHLRTGWQMDSIFQWCEQQYGALLRVAPEFLESYFGSNDDGVTIRRFAIVVPKKHEETKTKEEQLNEEENEAIASAKLEALKLGEKLREEREREKRIKRAREAEVRAQEAERKKAEAMALREKGVDMSLPKKLSKKELKAQAEYKAKHKRMAKTGPAKKKYEGPGSKATKGKKKG
jgi:hypothetical protein